jgi:hypothetical protein
MCRRPIFPKCFSRNIISEIVDCNVLIATGEFAIFAQTVPLPGTYSSKSSSCQF